MELQHRKFITVHCNTHVHLGHDDCMEAIFIQGNPTEVEKLSLEIGGLRGVRFAKLTKASKVPT
jgi:CopG family nickel-responsive transcriptional regulator